ncbi:MAG: amidohydrolase [Bacteroidia bacterium]|nr:amidohydrolase [Bacteroidia bacterium]
MQNLNFTVVQTKLYWEDIDANLAHFSMKLEQVIGTDMIILPEMFSTGFSMNADKLAEESASKSLEWMKEKSKDLNSAIMGSFMNVENGKFYNTLAFVRPDGHVETYHKRHLFSPGEESKYYTKGQERLIIEYKGWKICPMICYDLRFPVFSRNDVNYDVLVYIANWPEKRNYAWQQLLKARAIENQCYVIACNRIGEDGQGVNHIGNSAIINYMGEEIGFGNEDQSYSFNLSQEPLFAMRKQFPVLEDRDEFKIN